MTARVPGLPAAKMVFFDFDGVIKQSVEVKGRAFAELFRPHGAALSERVLAHHLANSGLSRFEKMPKYLEWAGEEPTAARVDDYCHRFAARARQGVMDAAWVPGAQELLRANPYRQTFVLVTAAPREEIEDILMALELRHCFDRVYGAPTRKLAAIQDALRRCGIAPEHCLAIGDARADYDAAHAAGVPFVLVRHASNTALFADYDGHSIEDFTAP
jgi:phosphoglycolate phosphatase-like HAD superfamily hydrolase